MSKHKRKKPKPTSIREVFYDDDTFWLFNKINRCLKFIYGVDKHFTHDSEKLICNICWKGEIIFSYNKATINEEEALEQLELLYLEYKLTKLMG